MPLFSLHLPHNAIMMTGALLCGVSTISPSHGQPPLTNSGTLTCTVVDTPKKSRAAIELSCNFKSQSGIVSDYAGTAGTKADGSLPGKYVFVWTVVALERDKAPVLDGTFAAEPGRQGPAVLIGGGDGSIRLEPVTGNEQLAGPTEITTLALKMASTKT
jgi:hypothetical protein